jgi:hypothetical protein
MDNEREVITENTDNASTILKSSAISRYKALGRNYPPELWWRTDNLYLPRRHHSKPPSPKLTREIIHTTISSSIKVHVLQQNPPRLVDGTPFTPHLLNVIVSCSVLVVDPAIPTALSPAGDYPGVSAIWVEKGVSSCSVLKWNCCGMRSWDSRMILRIIWACVFAIVVEVEDVWVVSSMSKYEWWVSCWLIW